MGSCGSRIYFVWMRYPVRVSPTALIFTALLSTFLTGCGMVTTADWRRCTFDVTEVAFQGLRDNHSEWRVAISAINPGTKNLKVDGIQLWALMSNDTLARLRDPGRIELEAGDTTELFFDVIMPQAAWSKALRTMRQTGSSEILITGDVTVPTLFGSRLIRNAVREKHTVDMASLIGGDFLRGLFR
jgi:hypothetical protein